MNVLLSRKLIKIGDKTPNKRGCDDNFHTTKRYHNQLSPDLQVDERNRICTRHSSYLRLDQNYIQSEGRKKKLAYEVPLLNQLSTTVTIDIQPSESRRTKIRNIGEDLVHKISEKESLDTHAGERQRDINLDRVTRDEIVRKVSACLSFYGNFVIIPALHKTLKKIKGRRTSVKLSYWHEVMAFIDSYDLPFADETKKKLIDELVKEIIEFIERQGILFRDWKKIICTLPDDVSSKFDYRLKSSIFEEVKDLAARDQLPFDLSKPILKLLQSAEKYANEHILKD